MRRLVEVAPKVAGLPAGLALPLREEGSDDCLVCYQNTLPGWMAENAPEHLPEFGPDLDAMSPVQPAALLANTEAEILEHSRAAAQGIVVWLDDLDVAVDSET